MIQLLKIESVNNQQVEDYQREFLRHHEIIHGSNGLTTEFDIEKWRKKIMKNEVSSPSNWVVSSQFVLINEATELVGMLDLRHKLNAHLEKEGGHIGYSIRKSHRGLGYAKCGLKEALKIAKSELNLKKVLLTCDESNSASKAVILSVGGVLDSKLEMNRKLVERYWVDLSVY